MAEKIGRRLRRATNAGKLRHAMRLDIQFPARLDDGRGNRVMPATRAQGGNGAFVIAPRIADVIDRQCRMVKLGFDDISHSAESPFTVRRNGVTFKVLAVSEISLTIKRAVIGVPS